MFHKIAGLLYDFLPKRKNGNVKVMEMLVQLYPNASESSLKRRYETGRLQKVLTILSVGSITAFALWISDSNRGFLVNNRYILRAEQGGEEKTVLLTAKRENGEKIDTEITVRESRFQDGELEMLYEDMLQAAVKTALGENRRLSICVVVGERRLQICDKQRKDSEVAGGKGSCTAVKAGTAYFAGGIL